MMNRKIKTALCLILIYISIISTVFPHIEITKAESKVDDTVPIKWGIIIMGGYDYYRDLTYNAIQRVEKVIQGRGVPYDLIPDTDLIAPSDDSLPGKYSLQFLNGTVKYQAIVILLDWWNKPGGVNQNYIYWAIGNGTNTVIFDRAAQVVPKLLGINATDVRFSWVSTYTSCTVSKTFNDSIKEYKEGSSIKIGSALQWHTIIHKYNKMTIWFNRTWGTNWSIGMANTTYKKGEVWYLGWNWNDAFRMDDATSKYMYTWSNLHFDFWGHAINFALNKVEKIPVAIMPYKKWKGAWILRFDTDNIIWLSRTLPTESVLKSGWVWNYQYSTLGYGRAAGVNALELSSGFPDGYKGRPGNDIMYTDVIGVLQKDLIYSKDYKAIIYKSSNEKNYDSLKIDFNENKDFSDDVAYRIWENITYPTIQGKLYWNAISPDTINPEEINIGWWQTPMLMEDEEINLPKWKLYGNQYGLNYAIHGWQHVDIGQTSDGKWLGSHGIWNGSDFVMNATYIEKKFNDSRYWMIEKFNSTGNGFEENEVVISHPNDMHLPPVDNVLANLTWVLFSYPGQEYFYGFGKNSTKDKYWLSSSRIEDFYSPSTFKKIQEIGQTLYSYISTYSHYLDEKIFKECESHSFPPYSDSIKPANQIDAFNFWLNSKYMLENTANSYYKDSQITLEFKANSTLEDFVWKFPLTYDGKYFNGFKVIGNQGQIQFIDGEYVYLEFEKGQGVQRIEVYYGNNPYVKKVSSNFENVTQEYTHGNFTIMMWNPENSLKIDVDCTRLGQPSSIKLNGSEITYVYDPLSKNSSFNITRKILNVVELFWSQAPPDPPTLQYPAKNQRFDPNKTLTFEWNSSDPGEYQHAYAFQLDDNSNFSSPIIDIKKVISNFTKFTQEVPSELGPYFWRAKIWDIQDIESDWSDVNKIIVDKIKIIKAGSINNRVDIGSYTDVCFSIKREYDNTILDDKKVKVFINDTSAKWDEVNKYWKLSVMERSVGSLKYHVSNIIDLEYGLTQINDEAGTQNVIWDILLVWINSNNYYPSIGNKVDINVTAIYAFDNKNVEKPIVEVLRDGTLFSINSFYDTSSHPITHEYTVRKVIENKYGLKEFTSNSITIKWIENSYNIQTILDNIFSNYLILILSIGEILLLFILIKKYKFDNSLLINT